MVDIRIDPEQRASFKRCRTQWHFAAPQRRALEPVEGARAVRAAALKDALAVYYYPGTWDWQHELKQSLVHKAVARSLADAPGLIEATSRLLDRYDAEHRLTEALPKMAEAASSSQLKQAFQDHLTETRGHVARLEQVFRAINTEPERTTCQAMKGLVAEGEEMIKAKGDPDIKDAALIAAAQRVEHAALDRPAQSLGVDDEAAVVSARDAAHADCAG